MHIKHHGAVKGVTGSCHQLFIDDANSVLVDCGLFQGEDSKQDLAIEFDISTVKALIVTHCHIDHVGRIPYLLAAGFKGPIFTTIATAKLLPMVIEDALKVGVTRDEAMIRTCLKLLKQQIVCKFTKTSKLLAIVIAILHETNTIKQFENDSAYRNLPLNSHEFYRRL